MARIKVPAVYARGGTSKAVFFHEKHIPPAGPRRDAFLLRVMGSPNPTQIDGMGGTRITTSKIAIISPSERQDADVDYLFVQVGISDKFVAYDGNCGNISAAVGPFAIEEGLIQNARPGFSADPSVKAQEVRIFNRGTHRTLIAQVPIDQDTGSVQEHGEYAIDGVPGTGAPILMDYSNTIGGAVGKGILPTGNEVDTVEVDGHNVECTICDVANLTVFVNAADVGLTGYEPAAEITANKEAVAKLRSIRGKVAQMVGMCNDWKLAEEQTPMVPFITAVAAPSNNQTDIAGRFVGGNQCHDAMPGTVSMCMAACSRIAGSVVNSNMMKQGNSSWLRIAHPRGTMPVSVEAEGGLTISIENPKFRSLSFIRTARRIMEGKIYVPDDFEESTCAKGGGSP